MRPSWPVTRCSFVPPPNCSTTLQLDSSLLLRRRLKKYARPTLLCIDEVGYLSYDCHAADLLYEVINRRYERRSIIVTTNRAFKKLERRVSQRHLHCQSSRSSHPPRRHHRH